MNPLGNRARAEELARLLEGAVAGPTTRTAGLATLATRLRVISPALDDKASLRPEFRIALRQRLLAVAEVHGAQAAPAAAAVPASAGSLERVRAWSQSWTAQRRMALASGAMAGVVAITGMGVASSRSLPGQPFYSLKRVSEGLQLQLADNDTARGGKHLEFAATRLREVRALAQGDGELALSGAGTGTLAAGSLASGSRQDRINDTLADFDTETRKGRALLESVYRNTGRTAPLRVLSSFSLEQQARLATLIPQLPAGTALAAQQSLDLVEEVGSTAVELLNLGTCGQSCDPATGGPTLPVEPGPTPGASASPEQPDDNGVPPCTCGEPGPTPQPTPGPTTSPTDEPTPERTTEPTSEPTPTPTPTTSPSPGVWPTILPTILPTLLPQPTGLPTLQPAPQSLPAVKP